MVMKMVALQYTCIHSTAPDVSLGKAHKLIEVVDQEIKVLEGKPDELVSGSTWEELGL